MVYACQVKELPATRPRPNVVASRGAYVRQRWCVFALICVYVIVKPNVASGESFSLKCEDVVDFYLTLDLETRHVIEETLSGGKLKGRVNDVGDDVIHFRIFVPGTPEFDFRLDRRSGFLTALPAAGVEGREGGSTKCVPTDLRPVLSYFDRLRANLLHSERQMSEVNTVSESSSERCVRRCQTVSR